jgi:hypothetical protein
MYSRILSADNHGLDISACESPRPPLKQATALRRQQWYALRPCGDQGGHCPVSEIWKLVRTPVSNLRCLMPGWPKKRSSVLSQVQPCERSCLNLECLVSPNERMKTLFGWTQAQPLVATAWMRRDLGTGFLDGRYTSYMRDIQPPERHRNITQR